MNEDDVIIPCAQPSKRARIRSPIPDGAEVITIDSDTSSDKGYVFVIIRIINFQTYKLICTIKICNCIQFSRNILTQPDTSPPVYIVDEETSQSDKIYYSFDDAVIPQATGPFTLMLSPQCGNV
ncbi:MAG: hypothetical protein MJE68_07860 [Proteobacteria bacterium]|nr:hypothetical protein [Pseudomonadota bacterium]